MWCQSLSMYRDGSSGVVSSFRFRSVVGKLQYSTVQYSTVQYSTVSLEGEGGSPCLVEVDWIGLDWIELRT